MRTPEEERILASPGFKALVQERNGFAVKLSIAMLVIYYGFILLVAFAKPLIAMKVGDGVTSLGRGDRIVAIILGYIFENQNVAFRAWTTSSRSPRRAS